MIRKTTIRVISSARFPTRPTHLAVASSILSLHTSSLPHTTGLPAQHSKNPRPIQQHRNYVTKSAADLKIEDLQELYATAKDEYEIAHEETSKKTVYAADDRAAAQEEFGRLKRAFDDAIADDSGGGGGEEVKRRIGQRVRELEGALKGLEELALED